MFRGISLSCRVKVMAKNLETKIETNKIFCLIFYVLLFSQSGLYWTRKFRCAHLNTFFSMFKVHTIATFPPNRRKKFSISFPYVITKQMHRIATFPQNKKKRSSIISFPNVLFIYCAWNLCSWNFFFYIHFLDWEYGKFFLDE